MSNRLKSIFWRDRAVTIVLQDENGPCPLLAVCNILLLQGKIRLEADYPSVSHPELLEIVRNYLLRTKPNFPSQDLASNYERNLRDTMELLPQLLVGLDVNVKFNGIFSFEFTQQCLLFDLLNIRLVHGWVIDPQDTRSYSILSTLSYNQMVEKLISYKTHKQQPQNQTNVSISSPFTQPLDFNPYGSPSSTTTSSTTTISSTRTVNGGVGEEGKVIEEFYESTLSQLTYYGLCELHSKLNEGELCVFFRNNHFSTLYKFNSALYLLVTDQGFLREPVVWEKLIEVEGDSIFYTDRFERAPAKMEHVDSSLPVASTPSSSNVGSPQYMYYSQEYPTYLHVPIVEATVDNDYLLAYKLQQTELDDAKRNNSTSSSGSSKKKETNKKQECVIS